MAITPQRVLHDYLLLALEALGGSATKREALDWMNENFAATFTDEDRESQPTRNEAKWENQTAWERNRMVEDGLIEPYVARVSGRGVWTLTVRGRQVASTVSRLVSPNTTDQSNTASGGQARLLDVARRKKIEDAAQSRLMAHYRAEDWEVVDTRIGHPYDARAIKGDAIIYLEAKGTTTEGATVIVTRNEVAWARAHPGECVIGVWSGIEFDRHGEVLPDAGLFLVMPWVPTAEELDPIQYDWLVTPDARPTL